MRQKIQCERETTKKIGKNITTNNFILSSRNNIRNIIFDVYISLYAHLPFIYISNFNDVCFLSQIEID